MVGGVRQALDAVEEITVVGEAHSGAEVLGLVRSTSPDVVLLDLRLPDGDGFVYLQRLRDQHPEVRVIILSGRDEPEYIERALGAGAAGYIVKTVKPEDLPAAIRQALEGTIVNGGAAHTSSNEPAPRDPLRGLTERELTILKALSRGLTNQAIGRELWVTEQTVKFHLTNIYRKLGVNNRTEAVHISFQRGLVDSFPDPNE
jgi:DNA-binding NarL/FixJ family response regulator